MGVAGNALLLRAAKVGAPFQRMVPQLLGPVINNLEMVFGLLQRAVTLVYSQRISKVESAVPVDVERRHAAGFRRSGIQAWKSRIGGGGCSHGIWLNANTIP